jgi:hypothetical protein
MAAGAGPGRAAGTGRSTGRVVRRPVPLSAEYMQEILHLAREQHAMMAWQSDIMRSWAVVHGLPFVPQPVLVSFHPAGQQPKQEMVVDEGADEGANEGAGL